MVFTFVRMRNATKLSAHKNNFASPERGKAQANQLEKKLEKESKEGNWIHTVPLL